MHIASKERGISGIYIDIIKSDDVRIYTSILLILFFFPLIFLSDIKYCTIAVKIPALINYPATSFIPIADVYTALSIFSASV